MTQLNYSLLVLLAFLLGFLFGVMFYFFHKGKLKAVSKALQKEKSSYLPINEEYRNFLNYEGYEQ